MSTVKTSSPDPRQNRLWQDLRRQERRRGAALRQWQRAFSHRGCQAIRLRARQRDIREVLQHAEIVRCCRVSPQDHHGRGAMKQLVDEGFLVRVVFAFAG
jgi:hypothetical protein